MKKITFSLSTLLGIIVTLLGATPIFASYQLIHRMVTQEPLSPENLLITTSYLALAVPGFIAMYFGFRLVNITNKKNIKACVGLIAIIGAIALTGRIGPMFPDDLRGPTPLLLATLIVIPIYITISRFLIKRAGFIPAARGEFVGNNIVLILAFLLWMVCSDFVQTFAPDDIHSRYLKQWPWDLVGPLGSLLLAMFFYKLTMIYIQRKAPNTTTQAPNPVTPIEQTPL